jgi:hypothetical protein
MKMMKTRNLRKNKAIFILFAIFLVSCSSVTIEQAENSAREFVATNVKFRVDNETVTPNVFIADRKKEGSNFVFTGMASTTKEDEKKSAKFSVVVDKNGNVIRFNNNPVSALPSPN